MAYWIAGNIGKVSIGDRARIRHADRVPLPWPLPRAGCFVSRKSEEKEHHALVASPERDRHDAQRRSRRPLALTR